MAEKLPPIIVTGASGFVGRHFLETAKEDYLIYAIARRSQIEAGITAHPNIKWIQVDITNWSALKKIMRKIKELGGADFILHLAAYYDFSYRDHIEYTRTNVHGMRHLLELAKWLCVERFVFASSLVVCKFPPSGAKITEQSLPDADFPYSRSKRKGEEMLRDYAQWFPCSVVRLAAVFSDWCEYPPLYMFLSTWLSNRWNAKILGGRGCSAVPYIHVQDLNKLFIAIFNRTTALAAFDIYNASSDGATSHYELFKMATRYYFGHTVRPMFLPKVITYPGVISRDLLGRLIRKRPFEKPWMIKYLDHRLVVDSAYTRKNLGWEPRPRYHVLRRLLFLIEKMKSHPASWMQKNEAALKRGIERSGLIMYEHLASEKANIIRQIMDYILASDREERFRSYQKMCVHDLEGYVGIVYWLFIVAVRSGDRSLLLQYAYEIGHRRFEEGFKLNEICGLLQTMTDIMISILLSKRELQGMKEEIYNSIKLTAQIAIDGLEDVFESFLKEEESTEDVQAQKAAMSGTGEDLEKILYHLDYFFHSPAEK